MKFIIDNWTLIAVALASGGMLLWPILQSATAAGVAPNTVVQLLNREKGVLIDVCQPEEFAQGHIVGAKNIPLAELESKLPGLVKNKAVPVVLVCQSGNRSGRAVATAKRLGYQQAQSLAGGLKAWKAANLPVDKA